MTTAEAMEKIESPEFSATVNVASDFRTFLRALSSHEAVQSLAREMRSPVVRVQVLSRTFRLAGKSVDGRYEHPADAALAAYLWLLGRKRDGNVTIAAEAVLRCKNCWWARKVAEEIRKASESHSRETMVTDKSLPNRQSAGDCNTLERHLVSALRTNYYLILLEPLFAAQQPEEMGLVFYPTEAYPPRDFFVSRHAGNRLIRGAGTPTYFANSQTRDLIAEVLQEG